MDLMPDDWKFIATTFNRKYSKTLLKTFCCNKTGKRKVKDFQKLFKKEILQENVSKSIFHDQILWMEGIHILSFVIWRTCLTDLFIKSLMDLFFLSGINLSIFFPLNFAIYTKYSVSQM